MGMSLLKKIRLLPCYFLLVTVSLIVSVAVDTSVAGLQNDQPVQSLDIANSRNDFAGNLLDALAGDANDTAKSGFAELGSRLSLMLPDLITSFTNVSATKSAGGALGFLVGVLVLLAVALLLAQWLTSWLNRKYLSGNLRLFKEPGSGSTIDKLSEGVVHSIPGLLGITVFLGLAVGGYALLLRGTTPAARLVFVALLLCVVGYRFFAILADLLFAPESAGRRLLPFSDNAAAILGSLSVKIFSYIFTVFMLAALFVRLTALPMTVLMFKVVAASFILIFVAWVAVCKRRDVAAYILTPSLEDPGPPSPGRKNFALIWHILFILYCIMLWGMLVNASANQGSAAKGAFLMSFFILPIWLVLDWLLVLIVRYAMATMKIYDYTPVDETAESDAEREPREQGRATLKKVLTGARTVLVVMFLVWFAHLWGYSLPFAAQLSKAIFDSILIIALALTVWRFVSNWIEMKIAAENIEGEAPVNSGDEFGEAVARGRAYTLLPILRKSIGVVLGVMVTLTVLSSLGVDIGPLLAGAGVVGLAVGFGAQKLVADILSGFFYLLDDAFRIGEYLQAGSVSGTVESITLRNVMLRHHRGMLQIIPHSNLGTITNFMRGGIIEKFNLDFPYDADIDKIRKIIKKVGAEMLEDPEFADDFIQPVKSQGVREIRNSVMSIRVKFTARPGKHFVIRREAYKRITEALNAKGIHYAHRKVIVDIPTLPTDNKAPAEIAALAAGGAAQQLMEEEEQASQQMAEGKSG